MTSGDDAAGEPHAQGRNDGHETDESAGPVLSRHRRDGVEVLALAGELDLDSVQDIVPVLDEALGAAPGSLVVDLSQVTFADSSALNLLLRTHTQASLHVSGPLHPFVERVFEVTGISGVLNLHPSLDEAVRAAARGT